MTENETKIDKTPDEASIEPPTQSMREDDLKAEPAPDTEQSVAVAVEETAGEEEESPEAEAAEEEAEPEAAEEEAEPAAVEEEEEEISALDKVAALTSTYLRDDIPNFRPGDTVKVHVKIVESNKERVQVFEGVVISLKHGGIDRTFTVRKTSWGVGVERTFFLHSTKIHKIEVVRRGHVRRAKLYYLRERAGKSARIRERHQSRD